MEKKKKQNRRSRAKYPNLDPKFNLKIRADVIDFDYIHKLNDKEKAWLDTFVAESVSASFKKEAPKRKGKRRKLKNLHKTKKLRQACNKANNDRNADVYALSKARGNLLSIDEVCSSEEELNDKLQELADYGYKGKDD